MIRVISILLIYIMTTSSQAQSQDPWAVYMSPAEVHTFFSQYTGDFKMEMTVGVGSAQPTVFVMDSQHKMLLGGRFLEMKQQGQIMGMDYEAVMSLGYNTIDKNITLITITNMGTGTLSLTGNWDESTQSATLYGKLTNPVSKNIINVKQIISFPDKGTILIESFDQESDKPEVKTVQYKLSKN